MVDRFGMLKYIYNKRVKKNISKKLYNNKSLFLVFRSINPTLLHLHITVSSSASTWWIYKSYPTPFKYNSFLQYFHMVDL